MINRYRLAVVAQQEKAWLFQRFTKPLTIQAYQAKSILQNWIVLLKNKLYGGGNYFLEYLNATEGMIVWDKKRRGLNFADCEIAWTNIQQPCRIFEFMWNGMLQQDMKNKEERIHPTQKPVALYKWILTNYAKEGDKILDTHVGSASSLIACYDMGFDYVGFEIDEEYYRQATKRLEEEKAQVRWTW